MKLIIAIAIIVIATIHGYGAAWLAIWMLFHPYQSVKLFGLTIWPQGMIPRHREKLAQSIGNAVGNELVSQQTVFDALFETSFFQNKVEDFVKTYTDDLLGRVYPSFIDALPSQARAPILDTIAALQYRLAEYIAEMLKSEETAEAIERFVDKQVSIFPAPLVSMFTTFVRPATVIDGAPVESISNESLFMPLMSIFPAPETETASRLGTEIVNFTGSFTE